MKKLMLAIVLIALIAGCVPQEIEPVGTVLRYERNGGKGYLYIHHADGHDYACVVGPKFEELITGGFVSAGDVFDCTGLPFFRSDSTVTF